MTIVAGEQAQGSREASLAKMHASDVAMMRATHASQLHRTMVAGHTLGLRSDKRAGASGSQ